MSTTQDQSTQSASLHREFVGTVTSVAEQKTIHVVVDMTNIHPKYKKQYTTQKKYAVHDEKNTAIVGNIVRFVECRPLSKTKRWRLVEVVS